MKCPRDGTILRPAAYEADIYVEDCPVCEGIWVDREKLRKIEEITELNHTQELSTMPDLIGHAFDAARQKTGEDLTCPQCGGDTESIEYAYCSQVIINRCISCGGFWLDKGELQAIEVFYERLHAKPENIRAGFLLSLLKNEEGCIRTNRGTSI